MTDVNAKTGSKAWVDIEVIGRDGHRLEFRADGTMSSWLAIYRWNRHHGYWRTILRHNIPDLPKHIWRSLWLRTW